MFFLRRASLFVTGLVFCDFFCIFLVVVSLVVITSKPDCLERGVSEIADGLLYDEWDVKLYTLTHLYDFCTGVQSLDWQRSCS